jgi:hypothetical protein
MPPRARKPPYQANLWRHRYGGRKIERCTDEKTSLDHLNERRRAAYITGYIGPAAEILFEVE